MTFGLGMAVGAALWSTPHWGSGSITVNNNTFNNFNRNFNNASNWSSERLGNTSDWTHNPAHRDGVSYGSTALNQRFGNQSGIDRNNIERQQRAMNDWRNNATPEDRQRAQQARENAQNTFNSHASAQEKQQASQLRQQGRSDWSQDKASPNMAREASQENQLRSEGRSDWSQDRGSRSFGGGERNFGGGRGGFGGGHFGGFRR